MLENLTLAFVLEAMKSDIAISSWLADCEIRGKNVTRYRDYMDGQQDARLTAERIQQLNLSLKTKSAFTTNYCDLVINTMVDRLGINSIETDNQTANQWIQNILAANDFEALQMDLFECATRDADTYVMVSTENRKPVWTLEPAWDGSAGMMVYYGNTGGRAEVKAAVKVWTEGTLLRMNVYYADRFEKYSNEGGKGLQLMEPATPWVDRQGLPLGVPVIHFANRKQANDQFGLSELENVIPLQDGLNRTVHSMVATAEYTAFRVRYSIGLPAPTTISPGSFLSWVENVKVAGVDTPKMGMDNSRHYEVGEFGQGDVMPFIDQCNFFIEQIGDISRTPTPKIMGGDNASGESLKQREVGLLGKVKRFQTKANSAFKQLVNLTARVQATFGEEPPTFNSIYVKWRDADIRNEAEIISNAKLVRDDIPRVDYLRLVAPAFGWDEKKIQDINKAMEEQATRQALLLGSSLTPDFSQASIQVA